MVLQYAERMTGIRPSAIRDLLRHGADPAIISFGGGYPDPALFPIADLEPVVQRVLSEQGQHALQYTVSDGNPRLRAQVAARMTSDHTSTDVEEVLITNGGQQGIDLAAKLVIDPGDTVIVEDPTFLGALLAFNPYQPSYATVGMDELGMDTDALERVIAANPRAKLIYTVPDFQNPTGVTMSLERRQRLIELANAHDLLVVEDSPYRALRYEGDAVPTIKSLDTEGRVIHLGSFSKILAPGMRLGWTVASPEITARLGLLKLAADTQCGTFAMAITSAYLDSYDIDAHIADLNATYRRKRDLMLDILDTEFPQTVTHTRPEGGLFTWLQFPETIDTARFMLDYALPQAHVAYVPGATFFAHEHHHNYARVSYSGSTDQEIVTGMRSLGSLLTQVL